MVWRKEAELKMLKMFTGGDEERQLRFKRLEAKRDSGYTG